MKIKKATKRGESIEYFNINDENILNSIKEYSPGIFVLTLNKNPNIIENGRCIYKCDVCGIEYRLGNTIASNRQKICANHIFFAVCSICGEKYEVTPNKIGFKDENGNSIPHGCCGSCRTQIRILNNKKPKICPICGKLSEIGLDAFNKCPNCTIKHNLENAKKNISPGNCNKCGKYSENRNSSGLCEKCSSEYGKKNVENNKSSGPCSICGIFNNFRDQNCRGKDKCNCSNKWYNEHNNSKKMRNISSKLRIEQWKDSEYASKIAKNLGSYLGNPDWAREVGVKGRETVQYLWKNDPEWTKKQKEIRIEKIKEFLSNIDIKINSNSIDISKISELKREENDICGAYVIKAKFKKDIGTNKEGNIYTLLACKSKRVYDEIYWVLRVISQPEKQDKNAEWTIAKWWYISNLYYDFEFELLTDPTGVSEEEALLYEAKYAIDNDLFVEFANEVDNNRNRIPKIDKHSYWSL